MCDIIFEKTQGVYVEAAVRQNTFWQNLSRRLLLTIAVSIVMEGELANETVNYDTKTMNIWPTSVTY